MRDVDPAVPTSARERARRSSHRGIQTSVNVEAAGRAVGAFPEITSGA